MQLLTGPSAMQAALVTGCNAAAERLVWHAGSTELGIIKQALVLGMRCTSTSMRNKWTGLLPKLLRRVLMSVHAALNRQRSAASKTGRGPHVEADVHAQEDVAGDSCLAHLFLLAQEDLAGDTYLSNVSCQQKEDQQWQLRRQWQRQLKQQQQVQRLQQ